MYGIRNMPSLPARRPFALGDDPLAQRFRNYGEVGREAIATPFRGITSDGQLVPNLFSLESTGVSTQPVLEAASAFLASLSTEQRASGLFGIEDDVWRAWSNIHPFVMRHGVPLDDCTHVQRERALGLVRASCSARGFELARDVMKLNDALGEITGRHEEYGEWFYWVSIMGQPSPDQPWGWQIDGHHLVINCVVLGDQLVMSPTFFGSEPTSVQSGKHAGTRVFEAEEKRGLDVARGLSGTQRDRAIPASTEGILRAQRMDGRIQTAAFRDNIDLPYVGLEAAELSRKEQARLMELIELYTSRMRPGHAQIRLDEVARQLDETRFLWVGGLADESVFYYRIHSPVILIESITSTAWRSITMSLRGITFTRSSGRRMATTTARICCASTTRSTTRPPPRRCTGKCLALRSRTPVKPVMSMRS
jgi:hypothetical protein